AAERPAGHVHSFPEGVRSQQDTASGRGERLEQLRARCFALDEEWPAGGRLTPPQRGGEPVQWPIRGEEHEEAAVGDLGELLDYARGDRLVGFAGAIRERQIRRQYEQSLVGEVEGGGIDLLLYRQLVGEP